MLHYLEGRTFSEVGAHLSVSAEAARKRCERALARLVELLRGRGAIVSVTALASGLAAEFSKAAPVGLVASVSSAALNAPASTVMTSLWQSTLATMQTAKLSLAVAVLVGAAIPVGIEITGGGASNIEKAQTATLSESGGKDANSSGARVGESSAAEAGERLRSVFHRLEEGEESDGNLELTLRRMIYTLDAAELEVARELLGEVEKFERFREIAQAVYARWAELDPEAAIADCSKEIGRYGYYVLYGAFGTWSVTDPDGALKWLVSASTPYDLRFMGYDWLRRTLPQDTSPAVAAMEEGLKRDGFLSGVLRGVFEADPSHFIAAAESISDDYVEREASGDFMHFVRSWFEQDEAASRAGSRPCPPDRNVESQQWDFAWELRSGTRESRDEEITNCHRSNDRIAAGLGWLTPDRGEDGEAGARNGRGGTERLRPERSPSGMDAPSRRVASGRDQPRVFVGTDGSGPMPCGCRRGWQVFGGSGCALRRGMPSSGWERCRRVIHSGGMTPPESHKVRSCPPS